MRVLMILNHAPDYREAFLRELSRHENINLTVIAQPCQPDGLTPPDSRGEYRYIETRSFRFFGFLWQPGLSCILRGEQWDVVCVSANLRHLSRIALFLANPRYWNKWIWWGLVFGEIESTIVHLVRKCLFRLSAGCLVHSKAVSIRLQKEYNIEGISYNNTEVASTEFRPGSFDKQRKEIKLLFVGTYKPRKRLDRLIDLTTRRDDIKVRIVGPGMESLEGCQKLAEAGRLQVFGRTTGDDLIPHFDWADIVVSPGNVGLLCMNAARHGKGIVIDNNSYHGPEFFLAKEADQPFISFGNPEEVDQFIERLKNEPLLLEEWGRTLQDKAKKEYTIEYMADVHAKAFEAVSAKNRDHT